MLDIQRHFFGCNQKLIQDAAIKGLVALCVQGLDGLHGRHRAAGQLSFHQFEVGFNHPQYLRAFRNLFAFQTLWEAFSVELFMVSADGGSNVFHSVQALKASKAKGGMFAVHLKIAVRQIKSRGPQQPVAEANLTYVM